MNTTTQPGPLEVRLSDELGAVLVLGLSACDSTAEQARALGLVVGDTIEGREEAPRGYWHEARLTLLWLGEEVAVWSVTERSSERPNWSEPEECADWTLECRQWRKVGAQRRRPADAVGGPPGPQSWAAGERSKGQTMTEQETELLLKAGAAAGLDVGVIHQRPHRRCAAGWTPWNPLEDDGDALRLAVDLGLSIEVHHDLSQTQAWLRVVDGDGTWTHCGPHEYNRDAHGQTRRAIVTAAAKEPPHNAEVNGGRLAVRPSEAV